MAKYTLNVNLHNLGQLWFVGLTTSTEKLLVMKAIIPGSENLFQVWYLNMSDDFVRAATEMMNEYYFNLTNRILRVFEWDLNVESQPSEFILSQLLNLAYAEFSSQIVGFYPSKYKLTEWGNPTGSGVAEALINTLAPILL